MKLDGTNTFRRAAQLAAGAAALALTVSACSSSGTSAGGSAAAAGRTAAGSPAGTGTIATVIARTGRLGQYLTDSAGKSLYTFAADRGGTSACTGACTTYWPPVTTTGAARAAGAAKAADLGTIRRADGTRQVTYAGHPLYRFEGDAAPGDTGGQGLTNFGGKWWLLSPTGTELTGSAGAKTSPGGASSATVGGGYGGY